MVDGYADMAAKKGPPRRDIPTGAALVRCWFERFLEKPLRDPLHNLMKASNHLLIIHALNASLLQVFAKEVTERQETKSPLTNSPH